MRAKKLCWLLHSTQNPVIASLAKFKACLLLQARLTPCVAIQKSAPLRKVWGVFR